MNLMSCVRPFDSMRAGVRSQEVTFRSGYHKSTLTRLRHDLSPAEGDDKTARPLSTSPKNGIP